MTNEHQLNNDKELFSEYDEAKLDRYKKTTESKKGLVSFYELFIIVWSLGILVLIYFIGFNLCYLSDTVIIALITQTLATILGIPLIIAQHFFPSGK